MGSQPLDEEAIFHVARKIEDLEARSQYLDHVCSGDQNLRRRVEALLEVHEKEQDFLKSAPAPGNPAVDPLLNAQDRPEAQPPTTDPVGPEEAGMLVGPYKLLQKLGEGGMGEVWVAQQKQPVQRLVALKILKPGLDSRYVLARFEAERQALALMDHPNIARVFDAGSTSSGLPYFAMELVKGVAITQYCDEHQLTVRQRLELFWSVCQAVQHAHQKGIIHRDIKPSNVLVAQYDETPVVKVIDFGIAKAIGSRLTEKTLFTEIGSIIGTFQYMSPEQAMLNQLDVDTRSDIYSLGVLLYELLTGTTPLEKERLKAVALDETLRVIREEEPPKPSTRIRTCQTLPTVAAQRHTEPGQLSRLVSGELDWIVMRALEKDRRRRYETASALAEDVQHHLKDEPVKACPPSVLYTLGKFARKHKTILWTGTIVLSALLLGLMGTIWQAAQSRVARGRAEENEKKARAESEKRRRLLYISDIAGGQRAWEDGKLEKLETLLRRHVPADDEEDFRGFEWFYLWRLWNRDIGLCRQVLPNSPRNDPWQISLSKDRCSIMLRDLERGQEKSISRQVPVEATVFSPNGQTLAFGCTDGSIHLWNLRNWEAERNLPKEQAHKGPVTALAFTPKDGLYLVSGSRDRTICAWNMVTRTLAWKGEGHGGAVLAISGSPIDNLLAAGCSDRTVTIWDVTTGRRLHTMVGGRDEVRSIAFSPDGQLLAAGNRDHQIRLWDVKTFTEREVISWYVDAGGLDFSPDGSLDIRSMKGKINFKPIQAKEYGDIIAPIKRVTDMQIRPPYFGSIGSLVFSPDGKTLVSSESENQCRIVQITQQGAKDLKPLGLKYAPGALAASRDGLLAVGNSTAPSVSLFEMQNRQLLKELSEGERKAGVCSAPFSPSGKRLAVGLADGQVIIWSTDSSQILFNRPSHTGAVTTLCFCGDERNLLTGGSDKSVKLWDVDKRVIYCELSSQTNGVGSSASSDRGDLFAFGFFTPNSDISLWRRTPGKDQTNLVNLCGVFKGHVRSVWGLKMCKDNRRLISLGADRTIRVWDLLTQEQLFQFDTGNHGAASLAVSPDERTWAVLGLDKTIRLFRGATVEEVEAEPSWRRRLKETDPERNDTPLSAEGVRP